VGRVDRAEEIDNAVVSLASDAISFVDGINLVVDGGQTQVYVGRL
jgi:NAD(P)-dependent dehydrogenase (short-subunit alcohol dehydrogenase family)